MKIIITGASGFIGQRLVSALSREHKIYAMVHKSMSNIQKECCSIIFSDLSKKLDIKTLPKRVDIIIHLAQANVSLPEDSGELFSVNTVSTLQLLDYGSGVGMKYFILASSGDVYGGRFGESKESDAVRPVTLYGISKFASEQLLSNYPGNFKACILRLFHPYGPEQKNRLIPKIINSVLEKRPIQINRGGRPRISPLYIDDVVTAFSRIIENPYPGIMNLSGDEIVSVRELAGLVGRITNSKITFENNNKDAGDYIGNNKLMKSVVGNMTLVNLEKGLSECIKRVKEKRC
jgi:nucleoside-diphosphate-sugar epimerase